MFISGSSELSLICYYCYVDLTYKTYVLCSYVFINSCSAFVICYIFQSEKADKNSFGGESFLLTQNFVFGNRTLKLYAVSKNAK